MKITIPKTARPWFTEKLVQNLWDNGKKYDFAFFRRTQFLWNILSTNTITMNSTTTTLNHRRLLHPRFLLLRSLPGTRISFIIYHSNDYLPVHLCEALWVLQFRVVVPSTSSAPLLSSRLLLCPFLLLFFLLCDCRGRTRQIRSRKIIIIIFDKAMKWKVSFRLIKAESISKPLDIPSTQPLPEIVSLSALSASSLCSPTPSTSAADESPVVTKTKRKREKSEKKEKKTGNRKVSNYPPRRIATFWCS